MIKIKWIAHVFTSQLNLKRKMQFVTRCWFFLHEKNDFVKISKNLIKKNLNKIHI